MLAVAESRNSQLTWPTIATYTTLLSSLQDLADCVESRYSIVIHTNKRYLSAAFKEKAKRALMKTTKNVELQYRTKNFELRY